MTISAAPAINAQLAELKDAWYDIALKECIDVNQSIDAVGQPEANKSAIADDVYRVFHDMKGQAGLFEYPLVAELSTRFCTYWRGAKATAGVREFGVARAHLLAVRFILERRIEGCGGDVGEAILAKLATLTGAAL